jgi:hypothetical protein
MTEEKLAKPIKKLIDLRVVIDPPRLTYSWYPLTMEQRAKELESWAQELEEFFRDHRSQDRVSINVEKVIEEVCNLCNSKWEPWVEDGITYCANCGIGIERSN